jgi:hypothetical protein
VTVSSHFPVQDPKSIEAPPIHKPKSADEAAKDAYRIRAWEYLRDLIVVALIVGALAAMVWLVYQFRTRV